MSGRDQKHSKVREVRITELKLKKENCVCVCGMKNEKKKLEN